MKTRMQRVFEAITDEQAMLLWEVLSGYVEDAETHETEIPAATLASAQALNDALSAAFASYAEVR